MSPERREHWKKRLQNLFWRYYREERGNEVAASVDAYRDAVPSPFDDNLDTSAGHTRLAATARRKREKVEALLFRLGS